MSRTGASRMFLSAIALGCALLASLADAQESGATWKYEGKDGPTHWSELNPAYAPCGTGQQQSPVDIPRVEASKLPSIHFDYRPFSCCYAIDLL